MAAMCDGFQLGKKEGADAAVGMGGGTGSLCCKNWGKREKEGEEEEEPERAAPQLLGEVRCVREEREALLRFKQGLIDYYGFLTISWGTEECCDWKGVVCSNTTGNVVALQLSSLALEGEINSALLELHRLSYLDLSYNYFGWRSLSRVPEFIASMRQLQHLNLRSCYFSGVIPPQLGNLTSLQTLDLSYNYLHSTNLDWLSSLSALSRLNLSYLELNGTKNWLQPVSNLHSLKELSMRSCSIGDVELSPDLFVNSSLTSLSILDLSVNKLTSHAFDWLFNMSTSLVKLDLSSNELTGTIPDMFGRFSFLRHLDLYWNKLEGEIPNSLGNLSHLQMISLGGYGLLGGSLEGLFGNKSCSLEIAVLSFNRFEGRIPEMAACSSLRGISFANNNLTGSLPVSIGELSKLEILDVSFNSLEGKITEAHFKKLEKLTVLDLSFNSLTVEIAPDWIPPFQSCQIINFASCKIGQHFPKWIQTQSLLQVLDLSSTDTSSNEIPKWLWSFAPYLSFLNLSSNQMSGTLPDLSRTILFSIDVSYNNISGAMPLFPPNISTVQFSHNMFSGPITSLCTMHLVRLRFLDISNNQFTGELPDCWEKLMYLEFLNLGSNTFSGILSNALGSLQYLNTLRLRDNNLSGEFPSTLKNCRSLKLIDIGGNKFTGNISWIGANYTYVNYLILRQNRFHGSIPQEICHLTRVRVLDLSLNDFSGSIPNCFYNFSSMVESENMTIRPFVGVFNYVSYRMPVSNSYFAKYSFENAFVQLKGQELEYRRTLGYLKLIDLSSNKLVGKIPTSLSSLKGLISLNMSRNSFTGDLIPDIGQMTMLECLDLSRNQLSGHIPSSLAQLTFLAVLDLANNNLSGKIPSSTQLQSFDASVYAGNDGLCGLPLTVCVEVGSPPINGHDHSINISFMQEVLISVVLGFIVGFWGIVGCLVVKKSWRRKYYSFWDEIGDWLYVKKAIFLARFK